MSYYNSNSYFYPRVRTGNIKVNHIVDYTPEEYRSTYQYRTIDGRPSDAFYFKPSHGNSREKHKINYKNSQTYYNPRNNEIIKEVHKSYNEPYIFNENGIIREKRNYILYENKNWTENIKYPIVEYEKIELPPPPKPKPKPKPKKTFEKSVEVIKEEIEREEDRKKRFLKSNFIREKEINKNKKIFKYKGKKYKGEKRNYVRGSDNIVTIYDFKTMEKEKGIGDLDNGFYEGDDEIKKIKKLTERKKINEKGFSETLTTRKEYKLHKTSTVCVPTRNKK